MQPTSEIAAPFRYPIWSKGDLDGFFGLMIDNLVQVLLIVALCTTVAGIPAAFVFSTILPGVAISLLIGNLFYGFQAHWIARRHNNPTCTALPYGINTPTVFAYVLFIMGPAYRDSLAHGISSDAAAMIAWKAGLLACMVSGLIEFFGAFVAERLRRVTPRAALLGVLGAIGITFIASDFAFRIYTHPLIAIPALAVLLLAYFAHARFPGHLPGGFLAIAIGTVTAWLLSTQWAHDAVGYAPLMSFDAVAQAWNQRGWIEPRFVGREILDAVVQPDLLVRYLAVSIPMGLMNVLGSLQNIESAEAGGDRFATAPSLAVNGLGTLAACLFGSCFPTTLYIGHPGWKALGARAGYSVLNGVFFTLIFLSGLGALLAAVVPISAGAPIVLYIGIVIAAQAFQATPREHAPAVAIAFFPAIAAMVYTALASYLDVLARTGAATGTLASLLADPVGPTATLPGILALTGANSGWLIVTLILAAVGVALIERQYRTAAAWFAAASALTALGLLHAYRLDGNTLREYFLWNASVASGTSTQPGVYGYRALEIAAAYAIAAGICFAAGRKSPAALPGGHIGGVAGTNET